MKKELTNIIGGIVIGSAVLFAGGAYENTYARGITGSTSQSEQDKNWRDKSYKNDSRWGKYGRKILKKMNPYNIIINNTERFSKKYNQFRERRERENNRIGIGTGSSTKR